MPKADNKAVWGSFIHFLPIFIVLSLIFSVALTSSSLAQAVRKNCNQPDSGERIKCKFDNVHSQLDDTVNMLGDVEFLPQTQIDNLKKARDRVGRTKDRTDAAAFKELTKKPRVECYVKEYVNVDDPDDDGDNDGICITKGPDKEICEEVNDDQIGDNDGKCEKLKGKTEAKPIQEACVEICDQETINADDDNFDPEASFDMEQTLDDTTDMLITANTMVERAVFRTGDIPPWILDSTSACANVLVDTRRFTAEELQGVQAGANAAKLAADSCDAACNQDSFGWNCSAVCLAFRVSENVLLAVAQGFELQDDTVTGERVDAAAECLEELGEKINGIEQKLDEIIALLNLPHGQRPNFPRGIAE